MPETSFGIQLFRTTALSREEVDGIEKVVGAFTYLGEKRAYVGNVGIKTHIPAVYKGRVNLSNDLDMVLFSNIDADGLQKKLREYDAEAVVKKDRLVASESTIAGTKEIRVRRKYTPYDVIHTAINGIVVDIFTYQTGIGPIPVNEEDLKSMERRAGLPVMTAGYLLATNLNPDAITKERINRVAYMLKTEPYSIEDVNVLYRKFGEALKGGKISPRQLQTTLNMLVNSHHRKLFEEMGVIGTIEAVRKVV